MTLRETYTALQPLLSKAVGVHLPENPPTGEIVRILGDLGNKYADRRVGPHSVLQVVSLCRVAFNINPIKREKKHAIST